MGFPKETAFKLRQLLSLSAFITVTMIENNTGRKVYYITWVIVHYQGKPKQELEAETTEEHHLLACFLWLAQLLFYTVQAHLPRDFTTFSGLGSPSSISN